MFPQERETGRNSGFRQSNVDCESLSFIKIFQGADLSSESMRAFPYDLVRNIPENDFSRNMVITTQWGTSWEVEVSMNPRFYYMEKRGWNQFVRDNALGQNELVTFTHEGLMCFSVNIYEENGKEVSTPRKPRTMASLSAIKKEEGESSNKDVKKDEETGESMGGAELKVRSNKTKKKKNIMSKKVVVVDTVPEFDITMRDSYRWYLPIPRSFSGEHMPKKSMMYTVHHSNGNSSWEVIFLAREKQATFSSGWVKVARQYPLTVGEVYTFKLIKPTEFLLVISNEARENTTP